MCIYVCQPCNTNDSGVINPMLLVHLLHCWRCQYIRIIDLSERGEDNQILIYRPRPIQHLSCALQDIPNTVSTIYTAHST